MHGSVRLLVQVDRRVNHALQDSVDYLVSACIIIALFILLALGTTLLLIQVGVVVRGSGSDARLASHLDSPREHPCDSIN